jgi:chemotaxis protein histidine kinase CheA
MDDRGAHVRQQVSELGAKFLQRTRAEASVLLALIERLREGDTAVLPELERMAHKIHGSGAMFGFPDVSDCAGEIERIAEHLMMPDAGAVSQNGRMLQQLTECLIQLVRATAAAGATLPESIPGR